jgi:hypothetical protein
MSEQVQILLNSKKNIASVNVDTYQKVEITNKKAEILEYDIRNILSATEVFDAEREANDVYRIYGRIEYLSLLNGLLLNYTGLTNFFLPQSSLTKNISNSIKFYLLKAGTGYTKIVGNDTEYVRNFEVIATPDNFELYNAGFSNNVYGEQTYAFNFNIDFHVGTYLDEFNFPATELYLYPVYQPSVNGKGIQELMYYYNWGTNGTEVKTLFSPPALNIGDNVYGDLIEYSKPNFFQSQKMSQKYMLRMPYSDNYGGTQHLQFKYNPFIPLTLRYFDSNLFNANTGSTSYAQQISIPYYATPIGEGNYVWKNILPQGNIDPYTNLGVDYPFINKRRYLFGSIVLDISPDLSDEYTLGVFSQLEFGPPSLLNTNPIGDINNIGKPCQ